MKTETLIKKAISQDNVFTLTLKRYAEPVKNSHIPFHRVKFIVELTENDIKTGEFPCNDYEDGLDKYYRLQESACRFDVIKWQRIPLEAVNCR